MIYAHIFSAGGVRGQQRGVRGSEPWGSCSVNSGIEQRCGWALFGVMAGRSEQSLIRRILFPADFRRSGGGVWVLLQLLSN